MAFEFFAEGLPYPLTLVYFYIEGLGFALALLYFYYIFVSGGRPFYLDLFRKFETPIIDRGYNEKIVRGTFRLSQIIKKAHSGDLSTYLFWMICGSVLVLLWMIIQLWF